VRVGTGDARPFATCAYVCRGETLASTPWAHPDLAAKYGDLLTEFQRIQEAASLEA
jgi:hypothetical protein